LYLSRKRDDISFVKIFRPHLRQKTGNVSRNTARDRSRPRGRIKRIAQEEEERGNFVSLGAVCL